MTLCDIAHDVKYEPLLDDTLLVVRARASKQSQPRLNGISPQCDTFSSSKASLSFDVA